MKKFSIITSPFRIAFKQNPFLWAISFLFCCLWLSTLIGTTDLINWFLENFLVIIFLFLLIFHYKKHQMSDLSYVLIFLYLCLHIYGSKYTYAENPLGYWLQDMFHSTRNHYDRIVHFSFGFLLAYPILEIFQIKFKFPKKITYLIPIELTLSISGFYELIEWAVADIFFKEQGAAYLGIQGDIWDAQKDMFLATTGAIIAIVIIVIFKKCYPYSK